MKKKGVEWPAGTTLTDDMREYAALHGVDPEVEFESWRDYHVARGNKFANWYATWMTWCRNAEKFKNEKRQIGFTVPPRLSMELRQAQRDNEEIAAEVAAMTPEQRKAAVAKLKSILSEAIKAKAAPITQDGSLSKGVTGSNDVFSSAGGMPDSKYSR